MLAQVEPGDDPRRACRPSPPERAEPFAAVLRDLDEVLLPGDHALAEPALLRLLRDQSAPSRAILAELLAASLNQVGILWRTSPALHGARGARRWTGCAQLLGLPAGWHGHIEDTASTSTIARAVAAREAAAGRARRRLLGARPLVDREGARSCSGSSCARCRPTTQSTAAAGRARARRRRAPSSPTVGTTSIDLDRPGAGDRRRVRRGGSLAARRRGLRGLGAGPARSSAGRFDGVERADSLVVNPHKWLLTPDGLLLPLDAPAARTFRDAFSLVPEYLRTSEDVVEPVGVRPRARPPLPRAQALGGAALLRARGAAGRDPRARPARARSSRAGSPPSRAGSSCAPRPFSLVCFRREGSDEENEALLERVNASGERLPLAHEARRPATCCGSRSATSAPPRTTCGEPGT